MKLSTLTLLFLTALVAADSGRDGSGSGCDDGKCITTTVSSTPTLTRLCDSVGDYRCGRANVTGSASGGPVTQTLTRTCGGPGGGHCKSGPGTFVSVTTKTCEPNDDKCRSSNATTTSTGTQTLVASASSTTTGASTSTTTTSGTGTAATSSTTSTSTSAATAASANAGVVPGPIGLANAALVGLVAAALIL